jgi:hypothetical protein
MPVGSFTAKTDELTRQYQTLIAAGATFRPFVSISDTHFWIFGNSMIEKYRQLPSGFFMQRIGVEQYSFHFEAYARE